MIRTTIESFTLGLPWWLLFVICVIGGGAFGWVAHLTFSKLCESLDKRGQLSERHYDIAGHFIGVVGVLYAVLVAFVVVTAWQAYDRAANLTMREQHNVSDLFHLNGALREPTAKGIQWMLMSYAAEMELEWNEMKNEQPICSDAADEGSMACQGPSSDANKLAHCIRQAAFELQPSALREQIVYQEDIRLVQTFSENREERRRVYENPTLNGMLWAAFLFGALILVGMTYFVSGQSSILHGLRTVGFFAIFGMMVALAYAFDRPFSGSMQVSGSAWHDMATHFKHDLSHGAAPAAMTPDGLLTICDGNE